MQIRLARGYVCATSETLNKRAAAVTIPVKKQDGHFHVTLLTKAELRSLTTQQRTCLDAILAKDDRPDHDLVNLGLGSDLKRLVFFDVIHWAEGMEIRKNLGLPAAAFHMTLSEADDHVNSLVRDVRAISLDNFNVDMSDQEFDSVYRAYTLDHRFDSTFLLATYYRAQKRTSAIGHIRIADSLQRQNLFKYAMCAYTFAADMHSVGLKMSDYCVRQICKLARFTEFPCVFTESELTQAESAISDAFPEYLSLPSWDLRRKIQRHFAGIMTAQCQQQGSIDESRLPVSLLSRERMFVYQKTPAAAVKLPRFFRWMIPYRLAVMATPRSKADIDCLYNTLGITLVVTLTHETPLPSDWFSDNKVENLFMPVENYKAPSIAQVDHFIKRICALPEEQAALVHCGAGKGRAGTFIACYLAMFGFHSSHDDVDVTPGSSNDLIKVLRYMRPGSIETEEQERFVGKYVSHLWKTLSAPVEASISEPEDTPLELEGTLPSNTKSIILCGLPGSGKSTFAAAMRERGSTVNIVSQDELGSRSAFINSLSTAAKSGKCVIVDKCHPTKANRQEALELLFNPSDALCINFVYPAKLCTLRANTRTAHPTIRQGSAEKIVHRFEKEFTTPQRSEGFACIATVTSFAAAATLLGKLVGKSRATVSLNNEILNGSAAPQVGMKITKFPRTRHLLNLGAATRDDLILSFADAASFLSLDAGITITIEEKVDGANMGISIDEDTLVFRVQNRSHYVNSKSHEQFRKLDSWLQRHSNDLRAVIEPGRTIVFGEWLYAQHSVAYSKLPDLFLIFDILDLQTGQYLARSVICDKLQGTSLHQVPSIRHPSRGLSIESLRLLATETTSDFYDGMIEGIYVRRERDGVVVDRAKVVRKDFIAGNDHWTKGKLLLNGCSQ